MKILLVEDDSFFAQRVAEYLSDHGVSVSMMRNTHEPLGVNLEEYNAAIIDIMLPNDSTLSGISNEEARGGYLSGVALARRLRERQDKFPVILLSADIVGGEGRHWAKEKGIPFIRKHEDRSRLISALSDLGLIFQVERPRSFIVHGHDNELLLELKDYLQNTLKWPEPIILRDQPNVGKTIIEKFEENAGLVDWIFVLISPDDKAFDPKTNDDRRRARQNVIFELGFFYGLIGRYEGRIIVLKKGDVEIPSDLQGIAWINADNGIKQCGEGIRKAVES
jgi:CheY-like chemotaxis protein